MLKAGAPPAALQLSRVSRASAGEVSEGAGRGGAHLPAGGPGDGTGSSVRGVLPKTAHGLASPRRVPAPCPTPRPADLGDKARSKPRWSPGVWLKADVLQTLAAAVYSCLRELLSGSCRGPLGRVTTAPHLQFSWLEKTNMSLSVRDPQNQLSGIIHTPGELAGSGKKCCFSLPFPQIAVLGKHPALKLRQPQGRRLSTRLHCKHRDSAEEPAGLGKELALLAVCTRAALHGPGAPAGPSPPSSGAAG